MKPIDASTRVVALLGSPVSHSYSPHLHNAAFEAAGLNIRYITFDVSPRHLASAVRGLQALGAVGANVTIPHKQTVARFVDVLSPVARTTGAVNTLAFRSAEGAQRVYGENSDVAGFLRALAPHTAAIAGEQILVLGTGGAARAVIHGLQRDHRPSSILVASRSRNAALSVLERFESDHAPLDVIPFEQASAAAERCRLIVNATPIGMHPNTRQSPLESNALASGQIVYDLVYNPVDTQLLMDARAAGAVTIDGLDMLLAQAAVSFAFWTGVEMPEAPARAALEEAIREPAT